MNQYFLFEGDYVYYFSQNRILSILENVATDDSFGDYAIDMGGNLAPGVQKTMMDTLKRNELSSFTSCFIGKTNSLYQYLETVSNVYYD